MINVATAALIIFTLKWAAVPGVGAQMMSPMQGGTRNDLLSISAHRTASGTAWQPDAGDMGMAMDDGGAAGKWQFSAHGVAFLQFDRQFSRRGATQTGSVNWVMGSATRSGTRDRLQLRTMLSADPLTVSPKGYPLLLQTGEVYQRQPIHDRQHPHDLFMEVAALYERALSKSAGLSLYLAPVGEPATGPVAYPHRQSARDDPFAPLGHHWQDATHISFGVATLGLFTTKAKLEGSIFNGREPNEVRTNFDYKGAHLDSYAGRLTFNPGANWNASASYAFLHNPEPVFAQTASGQLIEVSDRGIETQQSLEPSAPRGHLIVAAGTPASALPSTSLHRMTFVATHVAPFGGGGSWSTTALFGKQKHNYDPRWAASALLEQTFVTAGGSSLFSRAELVQKTAGDLSVPPPPTPTFSVPGSVVPDYQSRRYNVGELTIGGVRSIARVSRLGIGAGALLTANLIPAGLWPIYGTRTPLGAAVYLVFRPRAGHSASMGMM